MMAGTPIVSAVEGVLRLRFDHSASRIRNFNRSRESQ
jgi:hypothetical protein